MADRPILWMDGTVEEAPPGRLLSDNLGFYGDIILTGMTYTYLTPLSGIGDTAQDIPELTGRRLVDGNLHGRYQKHIPQTDGGRMAVLFDFKQPCRFAELDLICRCRVRHITVEVSADGQAFDCVYDGTVEQERDLYRCRWQHGAEGRYIRLTLQGEGALSLWQIWVWGDAAGEAAEKQQAGTASFVWANSISMESLPGAEQTAFSDMEGFRWMKKRQAAGCRTTGVIWSEMPAYGPLTQAPILPDPARSGVPVRTRVCGDGVEVVCLALTNADTTAPADVRVELDNTTPLRAELFVGGVMPTRWYGNTVGPLLNERATISKPLLRRYLTNASVIEDFPLIHLPGGGSCIFWLKIYGGEAAAGDYTLTLRAGEEAVQVQAEVLPLRLPAAYPGVWLWANETGHTPYAGMVPFVYADRAAQEAAYRHEVGTNVYWGWPEPGTVADEARRLNPDTYFLILGLGRYSDLLYTGALKPEDITDEVEQEVHVLLDGHIRQAEKYGVDFDHWFLEMPDEPGAHNAKALGVMVRLCKKLYPQIRIYVNPSFWTGFDKDGVAPDEVIADCLRDWYTLVDVSVPLVLNLDGRPEAWKYFTHDRLFNGQYNVSSQHMGADRAGLLQLPRICAWDSLSRGMNWWGFYSYHEPRLNSWDNTMRPTVHEDATINYQCVYAGVNGPVPTRASELIREGVQDYRIMQLLRQADPALYDRLRQEYLDGGRDFDSMKNRALDALLKKQGKEESI